MMDELRDLPPVPVPDGFQDRVFARLDRPAPPRRLPWRLASLAAAAGLLIGVAATWAALRPPPDSETELAEHARRARLFLMEAEQTEDPEILLTDYELSGLESQTDRLTSRARGGRDREYVEHVADPLRRLAQRLRRRDPEAMREVARWAHDNDVWGRLDSAVGPEAAPAVFEGKPPDAKLYLEARARLYNHDYAGAQRRMERLTTQFPQSRFAARGPFAGLGEGWMIFPSGPDGALAGAWAAIQQLYPQAVRVTPRGSALDTTAWAQIASDDRLQGEVTAIAARYPLARPEGHP